eukprot:3699218-Amphidinium_carterae.1
MTWNPAHVGELMTQLLSMSQKQAGRVRCREEVEDLAHIIFCCPRWHKERRQVELPADNTTVPPCVKLHGLLPATQVPPVTHHEPELVHRECALFGLMGQADTATWSWLLY